MQVRVEVATGYEVLTTVVDAGESWLEAAHRLTPAAEPTPVDLSGEVKRFAVDADLRVAVRAMTRGDLPDVQRWAWVLQCRDRHPQARSCFAAPDHRNRASLRMLAKLGFVEGVWFDEPQDDGSVDTVVGCTLDLGRVVG